MVREIFTFWQKLGEYPANAVYIAYVWIVFNIHVHTVQTVSVY
jgi:hypothetical protein